MKKNATIINVESANYKYPEVECLETDPENQELLKTNEAVGIRKELAYLTKKHREIMVLYYMDGKSVEEIARDLKIAVGTVKSRLSRGRDKIKKGVSKMDSYTESSDKPDSLLLIVSGITGLNNEPISVLSSSIEQNLLILAYENPVTIKELSAKIGIPTAFIEEVVDKLIKHEFMNIKKNKVWTNFLIVNEKLISEKQAQQRRFVKAVFEEVMVVFNRFLKDIKQTGILNKYNDTQLFLYGFNSIFIAVHSFLVDKLKLISSKDYPDRPNGGKWIIHFGIKNGDTQSNSEFLTYHLEGSFISHQSQNVSIIMWDTPLSASLWRENNNILPETIGSILYSIHKGQEIESTRLILIPDLVRLGLLTNDSANNKIVNIPIISGRDFITLNQIISKYSHEMIDIIRDRLIGFIDENILSYPNRIYPVSPYVHLMCVAKIALTFVFEAAEVGCIKLEKKNYPVCMLIEKGC